MSDQGAANYFNVSEKTFHFYYYLPIYFNGLKEMKCLIRVVPNYLTSLKTFHFYYTSNYFNGLKEMECLIRGSTSTGKISVSPREIAIKMFLLGQCN
jgi:hypothetical protein